MAKYIKYIKSVFSNNNTFLPKQKVNDNYYNPAKIYTVQKYFQTKNEKVLYDILKSKLPTKYIVLPQVNLQTIIETKFQNGKKERNNELFRNLDFCVFEKILNKDKQENEYEDFKPVLVIEINGQEHYSEENKMKRDFSVKQILTKAHLPYLFLKNSDLENTVSDVFNKINKKLQQKN